MNNETGTMNNGTDTSTHTHTMQLVPIFTVSTFNIKGQTPTLIIISLLILVLLTMKIIKCVQRHRKSEFIPPQMLEQGRAIITEVIQDIMTMQGLNKADSANAISRLPTHTNKTHF